MPVIVAFLLTITVLLIKITLTESVIFVTVALSGHTMISIKSSPVIVTLLMTVGTAVVVAEYVMLELG